MFIDESLMNKLVGFNPNRNPEDFRFVFRFGQLKNLLKTTLFSNILIFLNGFINFSENF
uniref:Uncharacterized protein n=1 Tax=Meloidogyne incognita TaxID=6306 RepID=A0A914LQ11_MELIC